MKKKIFMLTAIVLSVFASYAQKPEFGFSAGATVSNYKTTPDDGEKADAKFGAALGVVVNIPVGTSVALQTGLHWVQKGMKATSPPDPGTVSLNINCIEFPVNLIYNSGTFFAGAGPALGFNVAGKVKYKEGGSSTSEKLKFGNSNDDNLKPIDFGINALAGYKFPGGVFIMANFNQGLSNLVPGDAANDTKVKCHYFSLRIGYMLKSKK